MRSILIFKCFYEIPPVANDIAKILPVFGSMNSFPFCKTTAAYGKQNYCASQFYVAITKTVAYLLGNSNSISEEVASSIFCSE
jgi:hypothetical protein